ncbi:DUF4395 domain-containing protein [Prolixibacteraceae bacterium Z1-6]|uniref:DUF4395 domain-containing protein n=1 Tax=Draconibacterium aestuarii TaxID=2998507 RepID=A0A9X3F515_9BACT|nr:DUF4395 domain-containing protein [Prolixibacteraceae bacterium Z1-6]
MKQIVCPISNEKINEQITRLNALIGIVIVALGFTLNSVFFFAFLLADFYIRAFTGLKFSPISYTSHRLANALNLQRKEIGKAPKVFAARLGFVMTLVITTLFLSGLTTAALVVGGILVFFSSLEFALGVCMGCILYTYVILPFYK